MADHLWFIPVTGGGPQSPVMPGHGTPITPSDFNVQWHTSIYPTSQIPVPTQPCFCVNSATDFIPGTDVGADTPAELINCYGTWTWDSCSDDPNITLGGQLAVGMVFARQLPLDNLTPHLASVIWDDVDVWVKYRVDDLSKLSNIILSINDPGVGNVSSVAIPIVIPGNNGQWRVAWHSNNVWDDWMDPAENLRVVLTFLGTTNIANVGRVTVDVEWVAIRLRNER